eukprot:321478_1
MVEVDFYFDIVCPFAHVASHQINELCAEYNIIPTWNPVLLAGLYEFSKAPQGKKKSATSIMIPQKRLYYARDALWQKDRFNIIQKFPSNYPVKTLKAQRLLTAITDNKFRIKCAKQLYHDLWVNNTDINNINYLKTLVSTYNIDINMINNASIKQQLFENTKNASNKYNMFGVPGFVVRINNKKEHFFWGVDRLPFVEMLLRDKGLYSSPNMRLSRLKTVIPNASGNKIEFWFDFASPWSFLGYMRLHEFDAYASKIIYKPVLLGGLMHAIGNKSPAVQPMSLRKVAYLNIDFARYFDAVGVRIIFNSNFPVRTILPMRVFIIDNRTIDCIFKACHQCNINIGDKKQLKLILDRNGFDGDKLIKRASSDKKIKQILKDNTDFAVKKGMFGCPNYVVNKDYDRFCFGQDRMYFVKDMCCGWKPPILLSNKKAKL